MKTALSILLAGLALVSATLVPEAPQEEESLVKELSWLEGRWVIEREGEYLEETWSPAREDAMTCAFRWSRAGHVWLYELVTLEEDEEYGLVFRMRHFDRNLVPWKSEAKEALTYPLHDFSENRVVFENPERDSPRRFVYEREGDELIVRVEDAEGKGDGFRFQLDD